MDFHKILKIVCTIVFIAIIGIAALSADSDTHNAPVQQIPGQSKFNF